MDYLGGEGTRQLEAASPLVDARYSLFGTDEGIEELPGFLEERVAAAGEYDLVINLDSDPVAAQAATMTHARYFAGAVLDSEGRPRLPAPEGIDRLWHDTWNRADLLDDYPELESQFISAIFAKLLRLDARCADCEVPVDQPPLDIPEILFATGGNRGAKVWIDAYWLTVADWCMSRGLSVGLLGASPHDQKRNYHTGQLDALLIRRGVFDLRAPALTLPQVAGALARVRAFVTIDSGLLHIAAAVGAPTIVAWGDGSARRIWAPPLPSVIVVEPEERCTLCEENRFKNDACLLPVHQCMLSVPPTRVITHLEKILFAS